MKDYASFYRRITASLQNHREAVRIADQVISLFVFCSYPALLIRLMYTESPVLFSIFAVPAVSLAVISLIRILINRPRPYEVYDIDPMIPKESAGRSFPSRHIFSIAVIGMCFLRVFPAAGWVMFGLMAVEIYLRTAAGVHYPSDCIAGAIAGILSGLFLWL